LAREIRFNRDIHPELQNLAHELDEEELAGIARDALEHIEMDRESSSGWRKMHAHWKNLYFQQDHPINAPWQGSSDESMPILAEACNQFQARAFKSFFPNQKGPAR